MRINVAVPEAHVTAPVLNAALESVTRLNESLLEKGAVPTFAEAVKGGGIKWQPEPPGQEHFDHAARVLGRGWGDCDDLAPWHAASLRATGKDPGAQAVARRSGPSRWHAVVKRSNGSIDDPSRAAGMGKHRGIIGGVLPLMYGQTSVVGGVVGAYIVKPEIAVRPVRGAFQARADLPWYWSDHMISDKATPTDYAMAALHMAPTAASALVGAIDGVVELAHANGCGRRGDLQRLSAVSDYMAGVPLDAIERMWGSHNAAHAQMVGWGFLKKLGKIVSPVANLARGAIKFVPGIGPQASSLIDTAESAYNKARGALSTARSVVPQSRPTAPGPQRLTVPGGHGFNCNYF
jgi:hypothetical protein